MKKKLYKWLKEKRNRFISAWTEKNHKIYKFGKIKIKIKRNTK